MRQLKIQDTVVDFVAWLHVAGICFMVMVLFSSLKRHLYLLCRSSLSAEGHQWLGQQRR